MMLAKHKDKKFATRYDLHSNSPLAATQGHRIAKPNLVFSQDKEHDRSKHLDVK